MLVASSLPWATPVAARPGQIPTTGEGLYAIGCAACHGEDGAGVDLDRVGFDTPLPDFTDCSFAEREPDADWITVAHEGGPSRGFDMSMPAFRGAFSIEQLQLIMDHLRTFCADKRWPRGELNLPRALITEKAYPEDEFVYTLGVNVDGAGLVLNEFLYEKRFGARNQFEIALPVGASELTAEGGWGNVRVGDIGLGVKRTVYHDVEKGSIVSVGGELKLPTGSREQGFGTGTTRFEPFVAYGQILPGGTFFLQAFGAVVLSADRHEVPHLGIVRAVLGGSWSQGGFGRTWSPMIEVLGATQLSDAGNPAWSVVPQLQVSLNTRQHVLLNIGARVPVTDTEIRSTQLLVYLLWDWFDGGLFAGW